MVRGRLPVFLSIPALSTLVSGLVITTLLFAMVRRLEYDNIQLDLQRRVDVQFAAVGAGMNHADLAGFVPKLEGLSNSPGIRISMYAGDSLDDHSLALQPGDKQSASESTSLAPPWLFRDRTQSIVKTFAIAGKPHTIVIAATPVLFTAHGSAALLVLISGALLSLLAGAYLQTLAVRAHRMQRLIDEHATELKRANERRKEDVAARDRTEAALAFQASHDALTGLANPDLLRDRLRQAIAYADRYERPAWIMFVDLDRFKFVNDILSHQAGDLALKSVAERLLSIVRESDTVARIGGDEFVLLLPEHTGETLAETALLRVMDAVAQPIAIEAREFSFSCSVGIAVYPADGADPETLIKHAGIAMYRAKEMGPHHFQFYSPAMNQRTTERARIAGDLRNGLARGEFLLHYQPQVDLHTGSIVGMEALVRWRHPELGLLSPDRFIGLAEEMDLIGALGAWVLRAACLQNKAWQAAGLAHLRVAVNLSARQFHHRDLAASIAALLDETGLAPHDLELELTESMVMDDVDRAIAVLDSLKAIGVQMSIDDFGTGYSSLAYLKRFPIDILKIDQSFVRDITSDPDDALIVTSIIALAHSLRLQVVAEGVETEAQLAFLRRHDCDRMQGFHFSRPVPAEAFEQLARQNRRMPLSVDSGMQRRQTLLIVDDELPIAAALHRLLHREDYAVVTAQSGANAFEVLALHDVQVILCDQRMPGMDGIEFLGKVKDLYPDTVRIMLTGFADLASVIDAVNCGRIYRFFTKPWDGPVLRDAIRDAFRHHWLQHRADDATLPAAEAGADVTV